jgi:hypothetical protein
MASLLWRPDLPRQLTDIVVEFGNAEWQDIADRFVLDDKLVWKKDLAQIWQYLGFDQPVYEQLFRTVRAVNWRRPANRRIRVLLGNQPYDVPEVKSANDPAFRSWWTNPIDEFYTNVVQTEVLSKGRHALLIAGAGHLLRGIYSDRNILNVSTRLEQLHPGVTFIVDALALWPGTQKDAPGRRLASTFARWPRPSAAHLPGTWLGATKQSLDGGRINGLVSRAISSAYQQYDRQSDVILYLGPGEVLTASQADPTMFQIGPYYQELEKLNPIVSAIDGTHEDLVAESLAWADAPPGWFNQFV